MIFLADDSHILRVGLTNPLVEFEDGKNGRTLHFQPVEFPLNQSMELYTLWLFNIAMENGP
jgi:hypothetical protein